MEIDRAGVALVEGPHAVHRADRPAAGHDGEGLPRSPEIDVALRPAAEGEDLVPLGGGEQVPLAQQLLHGRGNPARIRHQFLLKLQVLGQIGEGVAHCARRHVEPGDEEQSEPQSDPEGEEQNRG